MLPLYSLVTPAAVDPVTVAEVKEFLAIPVEDTFRDAELLGFIKTATSAIETMIEMSLITTVWRASYAAWPAYTWNIVKRPFQSVETIEYVRVTDGEIVAIDPTTWGALEDHQRTIKIWLGAGESWPGDIAARPDAVRVTLKSGFGDAASDVPYEIRHAILMTCAKLDAQRGDCTSGGEAFVPSSRKNVAGVIPVDALTMLSVHTYKSLVFV